MNEQQIIEAALKDGGIPAAQAAAYRLLLQHADRFSAMENLENEEASRGRTAATPSPDATIEEHCRKMLAIALADDIAENPEFLSSGDIVGMANYLNNLFELSGAKSNKGDAPCSTGNVNFSGPAPESGLDPRVEEISRGHDGVWRAYGKNNEDQFDLFAQAANLADLVGTSYPALTQQMAALAADNSKLRERVEAQARQISHMFDIGDEADKKHADQVAALAKERDEARRERDAAQAECNRLLGEKRRLEDELANYRADAVSQFRKPTPTPAAMVRQFHRKFGVPIAGSPGFPVYGEEVDRLIAKLAEEFCEFIKACGYAFRVDIHDAVFHCDVSRFSEGDIIAVADGLADMQYMIQRIALRFGIPLAAVFSEVHRSNMTKTGLPDQGGKITKGDGYEPPQIERILREHGWEG